MASAKYRNLFQYLKKKAYPEGFTKQKNDSAKFAKKFEYDSKLESLFYVAKEKDGTALRRLVITEEEKARVFEECHSAPFSGHAGRDNTLRKIKERFYWPTTTSTRWKWFLINFIYLPTHPLDSGF